MSEMNGINSYVLRVAEFFNTRLGSPLVEVYKLGRLGKGKSKKAKVKAESESESVSDLSSCLQQSNQ
jgi:hypothetical protein